MDRKKQLLNLLAGTLRLLAVAMLLAAACFLLYRYAQYEEHAQETAKMLSETDIAQEAGEASGESDALLVNASDLPEYIRVRILTDNFKADCHEAAELTSAGSFSVTVYGRASGEKIKEELYTPGEIFSVTADSLDEDQIFCFIPQDGGTVTVNSITRAGGSPEYGGSLYLFREAGGIAIINELPLEEYLSGVVTSEMPSSYPAEALKAQAVCARTYAVNCIQQNRDEEAAAENGMNFSDYAEDLNDSVQFQVYNNYAATSQARAAVAATAGEILSVSQVQYYSTSCLTEYHDDLYDNDAFCAFLNQQPEEGAEYGSRWLRWEVSIPREQLLERLSAGYGFNLDKIDEVAVTKRAGDGQVQCLEISGNGQTVVIEGSEYIRSVLAPGQAEILLMDGSTASDMQLLPSAYFCCECSADGADSSEEAVYLHGGGYGHGIGMSQCGAAALAADGWDYTQILSYYF